jgi:hypothetical protein
MKRSSHDLFQGTILPSARRTEENHNKLQSGQLVLQLTLQVNTSQIEVKSKLTFNGLHCIISQKITFQIRFQSKIFIHHCILKKLNPSNMSFFKYYILASCCIEVSLVVFFHL